MSESLDKVNKINGYSYNYINNETKLVGVIAQELEAVLPEAVYNFTPENVEPNTVDPYKAVRYDLIVPLLVEAIKELNTKVNDLTILERTYSNLFGNLAIDVAELKKSK
jgi:hypothetical protein